MSSTNPEAAAATKPVEMRPEVFDSYDAFLKQGVRDYYERAWKTKRPNFIALVIASGQVMGMATDSLRDGTGLRKAALGAVGVVALRVGMRYFLSGPLGLVLSAAAVASVVSYFLRHKNEVQAKAVVLREVVAETRTSFEEIQGGYRAGGYDAAGRNLMVDGLLKRFLDRVDAA